MSRGAKEACSPRFQPCSGREGSGNCCRELRDQHITSRDSGPWGGNRESAVRMAGDAVSSGNTENRSEQDTHCPWPQNIDSWLMSLWFEKPIISFINSYQRRVRRFPFPSNRRGSSPQISLCPALYLHKKKGFAQPGWAESSILQ